MLRPSIVREEEGPTIECDSARVVRKKGSCVVATVQEEDNPGGRLQGRLHFTTVADVVLSPHWHKAQNLWCMQHRIRARTRTRQS